MEEIQEKKKGKGPVITIILLVIMILGLVCYICYDKGMIFSKKAEKETKTEEKTTTKEKEENVTFSDSELEKYVNYISPASYGPSELLYNIDTVDAKSLSVSDKIKYIAGQVYSKHTSTSDYSYDIISEADVKSILEEIYGPNTYEKTTFNLGCGDYTLNENDKNYYSKTGCGGTTATYTSNVITGYKATKSKLEITTTYAFLDGETKAIYKDYNKTLSLDTYTGSMTEDSQVYLDNYVKNNKDKLNTLVYTFESTNGRNYYFTSLKNNR